MSSLLNHLKLTHKPYLEYLDNISKNIVTHVDSFHCTHLDICGREEFDTYMDLFFQTQQLKDAYMKMGHYVLITPQLIEGVTAILQGKRCLEVMSGSGMLAHHLNKNGANVIPTDDKSWKLDERCGHGFQVHKLSAVDAIKKFGHQSDVLLMCWPYMDNSAYQAIKEWGTEKPILVCAEIGGCCADEDFHDAFVGEVVAVGHQPMAYVHDHFYWGHYVPLKD